MTDEIFEEEVQMAPQDRPWPADKLPKDIVFINEEDARLVLSSSGARPAPHVLGNTAINIWREDDIFDGYGVENKWSDKHARMLVSFIWRGIQPGASLFLPPNFPFQPDASAKRAYLEGYKQYTK